MTLSKAALWATGLALAALFLFSLELSAQDHPFGPAPAQGPNASGWLDQLTASVQTVQRDLYRSLATGLRALKEEGSLSALAWLLALSFGYGVLHAAGPGHGKVVLTAYLMAEKTAIRRGIVLAVLSAAMQAVVAIVAVGVLAVVFGFVARDVIGVAQWLERISFAAIAALGLYLIVRVFFPRAHDDGHHHDHADEHHHIGHAGHIALPTSASNGQWREMAAVIFSIGLRPCSGALLVLIFALANAVFWAGVLAAFAMAAGTAITVGAIAILSVTARALAMRLAGQTPAWAALAAHSLSVAAGLVLIWAGLTLALAPSDPLLPGAG